MNSSIRDHFREFWEYRQLVTTFVSRDLKARYKQTTIGVAWAVIQPLLMTVVFTLIFSKFLNVSTGGVPYPVFSFIALSAWTFFSRTISAGATDLIYNYGLISKVYFPREVLPLSTVLSSLVDFGIASILSIILIILYGIPLSWHIVFVPIILFIQILIAIGLALFASSIVVIFRDLRLLIPFLVQLGMYATPVAYSVRNLQSDYQALFYLNPLTGVIEGYRAVFLYHQLPNFTYLTISFGFALILTIFSYGLFKRIEKYLADVV